MSERGLDSLPESAKHFAEGAANWIRENPTEALIAGAGLGFVVGLTGFGRLFQGAKALRSVPLVSEIVMGALAKGFISRDFSGKSEEAIH